MLRYRASKIAKIIYVGTLDLKRTWYYAAVKPEGISPEIGLYPPARRRSLPGLAQQSFCLQIALWRMKPTQLRV
jgi:hypothetical protein